MANKRVKVGFPLRLLRPVKKKKTAKKRVKRICVNKAGCLRPVETKKRQKNVSKWAFPVKAGTAGKKTKRQKNVGKWVSR